MESTTLDTNDVSDCPPDMNADGQFTFLDMQAFLAAFFAGCP